MASENTNSSSELDSLKAENAELKDKLDALEAKKDGFYSYSIYEESRKKFLTWIAGLFAVITAFGLISASNIMSAIEAEIRKQGVDNIVNEIKDDFQKEHVDIIVNIIKDDFAQNYAPTVMTQIVDELTPRIQAKVDEAVREELLVGARIAEQETSPAAEEPGFAKAIEKSYEEERYYVIAGSSPSRGDLESELARVRNAAGSKLDELPSIEIFPPYGNNKNYALVIGESIPYAEAKDLQRRAIEIGFRVDTYLWRVSRQFFKVD